MSGFERREGSLWCDGVSLSALAGEHGTPLYVYSESTIAESYRAYAAAFAAVPHRICYALKANSTLGVLRILSGLGAGADIVSGFELGAALRGGFPADRVVFSGVGKTHAELEAAIAAGIEAFNAESEEEIERISGIAVRRGVQARVALRVNPDIDPRSHPYISTGLARNKFGLDIADALAIAARTRGLRGVRLVGLSCHIGSQLMDLEPVEQAAASVAAVTRELVERGFPIESIDIGGGLGIDYQGNGDSPAPAELARRVLPHVEPLGLPVLLEPGRSLVGAAGVLLTKVLYVKQRRGRTFVIVDVGMNDLLRPALYDAYHRIEAVDDAAGEPEAVDVVGPVCETGDFLARDRAMVPPRVGDLLAIRDAGAYGSSMASNYNLRPRPAEVIVARSAARLARRRQTLDDLLAQDS